MRLKVIPSRPAPQGGENNLRSRLPMIVTAYHLWYTNDDGFWNELRPDSLDWLYAAQYADACGYYD